MWVQNKHLGECNLAKRACNCAKTNKQKKQTITYISACNWSPTNKDIDAWESKNLMWNYLQRNKEPNKATLRSRSLDGNWTDIGKTDCAGFGMGMGCIGEERYTIYQFIDLQLNRDDQEVVFSLIISSFWVAGVDLVTARQHCRLSICEYWLSWTITVSKQTFLLLILILKIEIKRLSWQITV